MADINYDKCSGRNSCAAAGMEQPCRLCNRDIQLDLYPAPSRNPVVWGTVYDDCNRPISGGLIQLLQCSNDRDNCCVIIGETYSDCNGYYEIQIPSFGQGKYRIEVSAPCHCPNREGRKNSICYY